MVSKSPDRAFKSAWSPADNGNFLRVTAWISISLVFLISILDIIGWIADIPRLKTLGQGLVAMKPVTASCFILVAITLIVIFKSREAGNKSIFTFITILFLTFISSVSIFAQIYYTITGNESALTLLPVLNLFFSPDTREPILTATIFLITGILLLLLALDKPLASDLAHTLCIPMCIMVYVILLSYLLNAYNTPGIFSNPAALNTGFAFLSVYIAIFVIKPDTFLMREFTSNNIGGIMARRLLLWIIFLPVLIGVLLIYGENAGISYPNAGILFVEIAYTFFFILLIWLTARSVSKVDRARRRADDALKKSFGELEEKVRERTSTLENLNKALDDEITERIKAERLVKAERERFDSLLEIMPAYLILLTPDYRVNYSNRYFRERFGESHGKRCYDFLFNRSEPCEICVTFNTLKENKPQVWEWTGPDNHIYSIYDFPFTDTDRSPLIMEMGIDVTNLKVAEANLMSLNVSLEEKIAERTSDFLRANERLQILSEVSGSLLESSKPQELINSLCRRVMAFLDCQVFINFLADEDKGKLHLNSYAGIPENEVHKIEWLDFGDTVCGCAAREGIRIVAEDVLNNPDTRTELIRSFGVQAYACHPILSHDKVLGTLSFGTTKRKRFNEDDLLIMKTITDQVSVAMKRVKDETMVRKSEERYKKLLELSPSACLVDKNDSIVLLNPAARRLLDLSSSEEVIGKSSLDLFHKSYHPRIKARITSLMRGENVPSVEEKLILNNGGTKDIEVVSVAMVDSDGPTFQVIMNDITERKLAEKELFETKNYLQNLIDYANAPIIVWDQENKIRLFNHAFEHLTGYISAEVAGKELELLFPQDSLNKSMTKIKRAIKENWKTIEIPILTKNKEIRIVLWNSAKIHDRNRKTFSIIAQGNDITERIEAEKAFKESREQLEIALENGKIGIWEWNPESNIFQPDIRMERILGLEPGTFEKTYSAFEKCIHEEDLPHFRKAIQKALGNENTLDTIFRVRHSDNKINYISTKAKVERNKKGNPVKISGVCFDITEMKLGAEKVLFLLNEELLRSNKELEQFAYVASHDLQEPLRMVSSFTQLLARRYESRLDQTAQEYIQYAVEGAARMQRLINDLLDYSRIQSRGNRFSVTDMHEILGQALNNLSIKLQQSGGLVTNDELPTILADEGQIVQLLQNLIGNAIKFCKTSPRIHISYSVDTEHLIFSVKDNGIGIEPQYFEKIFQIFQRLHSREDYGGGTGIGLAICKRIIERHGGKIWVESKKGKGSVFYFTLLKQ